MIRPCRANVTEVADPIFRPAAGIPAGAWIGAINMAKAITGNRTLDFTLASRLYIKMFRHSTNTLRMGATACHAPRLFTDCHDKVS